MQYSPLSVRGDAGALAPLCGRTIQIWPGGVGGTRAREFSKQLARLACGLFGLPSPEPFAVRGDNTRVDGVARPLGGGSALNRFKLFFAVLILLLRLETPHPGQNARRPRKFKSSLICFDRISGKETDPAIELRFILCILRGRGNCHFAIELVK
ncbi:uncharacterized protein Tco025E_00894 [Trypanosoma conorhini]|uniref:Uncharacterized protein n=1 Tax=Trypanosoma conorhini TaxID=83891 RepID=A0A422QAE8_9TRYP|nr:uncharacterized protein Tco025E_00894 [Trypanosoma conorhini]RNF26931.1 hypothetical protein Tco025E_00894 [Trypanosoma conorhini]